MTVRSGFAILLVLAVTQLTADDRHVLCLSDDGVIHYAKNCTEYAGLVAQVAPSKRDRKFLWYSKDMRGLTIGVLPAGATTADRDATAGVFALHTSIRGPETADGVVTLRDEKLGQWTITLDPWWFRDGRLNLQVPKGTWDLTVTAAGQPLQRPVRVPFLEERRRSSTANRPPPPDLPRKPGRIALRGRAVAKGIPADFAKITSDCSRVVCEADEGGKIACEIDRPASGSICLEHPRLGRAHIELPRNVAVLDLGPVELVAGAVVRLVRPPHVELPPKTTVSLLRGGKEVREPQRIDDRETVEISGLDGGPHLVLLAGPEALQRKLFPIDVQNGAPNEVTLSIDAYRLTGTVEYREKPLENAVLELTGEAWSAELRADQSGRFSAELWSPGDYAVLVQAPALTQPYGEMKRVSASDSDWRFDVPSRRITGRVSDGESGRPIADASLLVESTSGETRWSRPVTADEEGAFDISGIREGTYEISARAPSFLPGERTTLTIEKNDGDRSIDLRLEPGVLIPLSVVDTNGEAVGEAIVAADFTPDGTRIKRLLRTDASGRVFVPVAEKSAKTVFIIPKRGSLAMTVLSAADPNGARVVVPDPVVTLALHARDADGIGVPNVQYILHWQGRALPRPLLQQLASVRAFAFATSANGEVTIPLLPAGRYEVDWIAPSGQTTRSSIEAFGGETVVTARLAHR